MMPEEMSTPRKSLKELESLFWSCIGNHDLRSITSRNEVEKIMEYLHSTFSFGIAGMHIVILGTYVNNELGTAEGGIFKTQFISNENLEWLKEDLSNNKLPTIICLHFWGAEDGHTADECLARMLKNYIDERKK